MSFNGFSATTVAAAVVMCTVSREVGAQPSQADLRTLALAEASQLARDASAELAAARAALEAASARLRQAGLWQNPQIAYGREQTSRGEIRNRQDIAAIEQRIEMGGQRGARSSAASLRRDAAQARVDAIVARIDFEVARAYSRVIVTDRRATLLNEAADLFARATNVSRVRLASGDISGYENRRLALEATRMASLRIEAATNRRSSRLALALLISGAPPSTDGSELVLVDTAPPARVALPLDSLVQLALARRADLKALELEARGAFAEAEVVRRDRIPTPVASIGFKRETSGFDRPQMSGFVAGLSFPLPLWDRRAGAVAAQEAEARRLVHESDAGRRQAIGEVLLAATMHDGLAAQLDTLRQALGPERARALHAAEVAYQEGELPLVGWLDAVRAYLDIEMTYAKLLDDYLTSRAALERAVGLPLG